MILFPAMNMKKVKISYVEKKYQTIETILYLSNYFTNMILNINLIYLLHFSYISSVKIENIGKKSKMH